MSKRGRGHKKIEQKGVEKEIKAINGTLLVYLPKRLKDLGVRSNQKVVINYETTNSNPLNWKIVIKPLPQQQTEESRRQNPDDST